MNILLTTLSALFIIIAIPSIILRYKRFKYETKLSGVYERMEMYFVRKEIPINNKYMELLRVHKNVVVNPELLDIQLLLLIKMSAEKAGKLQVTRSWYKETIESLDKDFEKLLLEFNVYSDKILVLSILKPDFLLFTLRLVVNRTVNRSIQSLKNEVRFVIDNEASLLKVT